MEEKVRGFVVARRRCSFDAEELDLSNLGLVAIPAELAACTRLRVLRIWRNNIRRIEHLPASLLVLDIAHNRIAKLENLPGGLHDLDVSHNEIKKLENLPQNLFRLIAYHNKISKLENLPKELNSLQLYFDDLTQPVHYLKDNALFLRQIRFCDPSRHQSVGRGRLRRPAIDIPQLLLDINSGARATVYEMEREKQRRLVRALLMHVLRKRLRWGVQDIGPIILLFLWA